MKIAVIGAGASGLCSVKECLDYGVDPVCFERTGDVGGLWNYKPEYVEGAGSVMASTTINTSKEMLAFSDFPPDDDMGCYMHHSGVLKYLRSYTKNFNLMPYIRFNTDVVRVEKAPSYEETGKWTVRWKDGNGTTEEEFDAVLLCNGHHVYPYVPEFPGTEKFQGKIIHSGHYKVPAGYEHKRVMVVGMGNTGGDIAVELSRHADETYVVCRSGNWLTPRVGEEGYPFDLVWITRITTWAFRTFESRADFLLERIANRLIDHELYGLKPDHSWGQQHIFINDDLPSRLASGTLKVIRSEIKEFTATGVSFTDGTKVDNLDTVILATGYDIQLPFLDEEIIPVKDNEIDLYKNIYPPSLPHDTLAAIGMFQPVGPIFPIVELQTRYVLSALLGKIQLPSKAERLASIAEEKEKLRKRFRRSRRHTIQVDYVGYTTDLATCIGVMPSLKMFLTDPVLANNVFIAGPVVSYQYRLVGIHAKPKMARELLLTVYERSLAQLGRKRAVADRILKPTNIIWYIVHLAALFAGALLMFWLLRELLGFAYRYAYC